MEKRPQTIIKHIIPKIKHESIGLKKIDVDMHLSYQLCKIVYTSISIHSVFTLFKLLVNDNCIAPINILVREKKITFRKHAQIVIS